MTVDNSPGQGHIIVETQTKINPSHQEYPPSNPRPEDIPQGSPSRQGALTEAGVSKQVSMSQDSVIQDTPDRQDADTRQDSLAPNQVPKVYDSPRKEDSREKKDLVSAPNTETDTTATHSLGSEENNSPSREPSREHRPGKKSTRPACLRSRAHEIAFIVFMVTSNTAGAMVMGSLLVLSDSIFKDLDMAPNQLPWISGGYALATGSLILPIARLADLYHGKVQLSISFFCYSSIMIGARFVPSGTAFIILVSMLGPFLAAIVTASLSQLARVYGSKASPRKNATLTIFQSGFPMGVILGMIVSGICARYIGWRNTFVCFASLFYVMAILTWFLLPNVPPPPVSLKSENAVPAHVLARCPSFLHPFLRWSVYMDIPGALLVSSGLALFLIPFTLSEVAPDGWGTDYVIGMLVGGLAVLVGFVVWEDRVATYPIINTKLFRTDRNFGVAVPLIACFANTIASTEFYISYYLQHVRGDSTLLVAVKYLPLLITGMITFLSAGFLMHRIDSKVLGVGGLTVYTLTTACLSLHRDEYGYGQVFFPCLLVLVGGFNFCSSSINLYIVTNMPPEAQAVAGGIVQCLFRLSAPVGISIFSAIRNFGQRQIEEGKVTPENDPYYHAGPYRPYAMGLWLNTGLNCCALALMVLFFRGGKMGHDVHAENVLEDGHMEKLDSAVTTGKSAELEKPKEPEIPKKGQT